MSEVKVRENKILYENDLYIVVIVPDALDENGKTRCRGYGILNKETDVREGTCLVYGETRWRADQMANMVRELDAKEAVEESEDPLMTLNGDVGEDVVPS